MSVIASKEKASVMHSWLCESIDHRLGLSEEEAMHVLVPIWYNANTNTYVYPDRGINLFRSIKTEVLDIIEAGTSEYIAVAPGYVIPKIIYVEQNDNSIIVCRCVALANIYSVLRRLEFFMSHLNDDFVYYVEVRGQGPRVRT